MPRYYLLRAILGLVVIGVTVLGSITATTNHGLPFIVNIGGAHHATLKPIKGITLPSGIVAGDRLDPALQPRSTRIAIMRDIANDVLPENHTYDFVISRGAGTVTVPVTTVSRNQAVQARFYGRISIFSNIGLAGLTLLILWWGRNRVALGMTIWTMSYLIADASLSTYGADGGTGIILLGFTGCMFLFGRIGFYVMADAIARPILSARKRTGFFVVFIVMLLTGGSLYQIGGPLIYIYWGWAGSNAFLGGLVWSAVYLVPIALLMVCYQHALPAQRLRLRWMLISSVMFLFGIALANTTIFGMAGYVINASLMMLTFAGFLYAVLRHRVVDVSVLIDSTLVYGGLIALVVGALAALNSFIQHVALGTNASLVLQLAVPLSIGIVLMRVRIYLERNVERLFFRQRYLRNQALRDFAERAGFFDKTSDLFNAAEREISSHARAPAVAIYSAEADGFRRLRQQGDADYPQELGSNDDAAVALRTRREAVDLERLASALGKDSCAFPLLVLGNLRGLLVVKNRPQEHFSSDEKELLTHVAQSVGAAWRLLRARDNEALVNGMAHGNIAPDNAFAEARRLALT